KYKSQRLALGFEPDLSKFFSPELQGCPLFRGRPFRKVHSARPPLRTNHSGQLNRLTKANSKNQEPNSKTACFLEFGSSNLVLLPKRCHVSRTRPMAAASHKALAIASRHLGPLRDMVVRLL